VDGLIERCTRSAALTPYIGEAVIGSSVIKLPKAVKTELMEYRLEFSTNDIFEVASEYLGFPVTPKIVRYFRGVTVDGLAIEVAKLKKKWAAWRRNYLKTTAMDYDFSELDSYYDGNGGHKDLRVIANDGEITVTSKTRWISNFLCPNSKTILHTIYIGINGSNTTIKVDFNVYGFDRELVYAKIKEKLRKVFADAKYGKSWDVIVKDLMEDGA